MGKGRLNMRPAGKEARLWGRGKAGARMSQYRRAVWMLGGWQAQWAEQGWSVWWNVPNFDSLLLLPGSLTPLHSCCATFHIRTSRSIQTRGGCNLRCLHILGVGGLVGTLSSVLPKNPWAGEGEEGQTIVPEMNRFKRMYQTQTQG